MNFTRPATLQEALEHKAEHPDAVPLAGGTDLLVDLNFDRRRPSSILDLTRVEELTQRSRSGARVTLGAGVTYARIVAEVARELPGLALASRTIGSPQIRNRATIGGNLGTASPAGDALPPLMACGAEIELASVRGARTVPMRDFLAGPKRNVAEPDELIIAVHLPVAPGPQQFSKIGTRNAMVIAVAAFAVSIDREARTIGTGIGSAGPVILRADDAAGFVASALEEEGLWDSPRPIAAATLMRFGELVAGAARPIDDVRGTAAYRRHALSVMAQRTLTWAWDDYRRGG
ncbi:FAD binding domain-containing protein [soil metagenome]